jgi:hypothetical protein
MNITVLNSLPTGTVDSPYHAALSATEGIPPYTWTTPNGPLPSGLSLDPSDGIISGQPTQAGTTLFTVQVTDDHGTTSTAQFSITVYSKPRSALLDHVHITSVTAWLGILALALPVLGYVPIVAYAFASPGAHWLHLATNTLTSLTAFVTGCFIGFIFATPHVVSSGQLKAAGVSLGSNLAEVSDWLTKLLLGAGLVQLTHLGGPIARLIDHIAVGLQNPAPGGGPTLGAEVMAGLIILGYTVLGLLEGYVVTSVWYPRKLMALGTAIRDLPQDAGPPAH